MATLAISLAGAGIGTSLGLTAAQGFLVGSVIGNLLFPAPPIVSRGPRLGDTSVSASTYGIPIPLGYGTVRMAGNMIWSTGLKEVENKKKIGGKGGLSGPSQSQISYTYFVSFATAFTATEADSVIRIWADSKLIFDASGTEVTRKKGLNFRFYRGTETQLPDALIEADVGEGNAPAHRGISYIVFDDLELTDFGNRIPNITAEIAFKSESLNPFENYVPITDGDVAQDAFDGNSFAFDPDSRTLYAVGRHVDGGNVIRVFSMKSKAETKQVQVISTNFMGAGTVYFAPSSRILVANKGFIGNTPLTALDADTLQPVWETAENLFRAPAVYTEVLSINGPKLSPFLVVAPQNTSSIRIVGAGAGQVFWDDVNQDSVISQNIFGMIQEEVAFAPSFWVGSKNSGNSQLDLYRVRFLPIVDAYTGKFASSPFVELIKTFPSSTWGDNGDSDSTPMGPFIDEQYNGIIFAVDKFETKITIWKWDPVVDEIVWSTTIEGFVASSETSASHSQSTLTFNNNSVISNGRLGWTDRSGFSYLIDTFTGELMVSRLAKADVDAEFDPNGSSMFDGRTGSIISQVANDDVTATKGPFTQLYIGRSSGLGVPLSSIIKDVSQRVGLDPVVDLDTTALTDNVRGFIASQASTGRQILEPLMTAFFFQGVESDFKIKFVKRGQDPILDINQRDIIDSNDDSAISEQRIQEVDLPERISVQYIDVNTDFQQGNQATKRILSPKPAMRSQNENNIQLPIVFTTEEAKRISEIILFSTWNERISYSFKTAQNFLKLDSGDVIRVILENGTILNLRISSMTVNADNSIEIEGISESGATFSSTAVGGPSLGFPQKTIASSVATKLVMLNIPLLRDQDELTSSSRSYYVMGGYSAGWNSGNLFRSLDGDTFDFIDRTPQAAEFGVVINSLESVPPFMTDVTSKLQVSMQFGELESVTNIQFLNDLNVAVIGSEADQNWEIVSFKDAVSLGNGLYEVSKFIRGKRGTDVFVDSHKNGELFIPLSVDLINTFTSDISRLNIDLLYRGVADNQLLEEARSKTFKALGRDLMPYAPTLLSAELSGNDISITWERRSRINADLKSGSGFVPLAEDSELYDIEILDPNDGSVIRTFTDVATKSVTYTDAQQTTDGLSPPLSVVRYKVYQISASVGRGFAAEKTEDL